MKKIVSMAAALSLITAPAFANGLGHHKSHGHHKSTDSTGSDSGSTAGPTAGSVSSSNSSATGGSITVIVPQTPTPGGTNVTLSPVVSHQGHGNGAHVALIVLTSLTLALVTGGVIWHVVTDDDEEEVKRLKELDKITASLRKAQHDNNALRLEVDALKKWSHKPAQKLTHKHVKKPVKKMVKKVQPTPESNTYTFEAKGTVKAH